MSNYKDMDKVCVPFSWENKPGIRKDGSNDFVHVKVADVENFVSMKILPPPPCERITLRAALKQDLQDIPLPPCAFQVSRSGSKRGVAKKAGDDPFLMAFKECTKGSAQSRKKSSLNLSCKHSCSVRDDSIVRVSDRFRLSNSERRFSERG